MVDKRDKLEEKQLREVDELKLRQLLGMADKVLGPIELMDWRRLTLHVPEIASKPPEYFKDLTRKAMVKAAMALVRNGEEIPSHVRSALAELSRRKPAAQRASGGQIEKAQLVVSQFASLWPEQFSTMRGRVGAVFLLPWVSTGMRRPSERRSSSPPNTRGDQ